LDTSEFSTEVIENWISKIKEDNTYRIDRFINVYLWI